MTATEEHDVCEADLSAKNSKKLDRILQLLEGNGPDAPGLIARMGSMERILFGRENNADGLVAQVRDLQAWRKWLSRTATAASGAALTLAVEYAVKHL